MLYSCTRMATVGVKGLITVAWPRGSCTWADCTQRRWTKRHKTHGTSKTQTASSFTRRGIALSPSLCPSLHVSVRLCLCLWITSSPSGDRATATAALGSLVLASGERLWKSITGKSMRLREWGICAEHQGLGTTYWPTMQLATFDGWGLGVNCVLVSVLVNSWRMSEPPASAADDRHMCIIANHHCVIATSSPHIAPQRYYARPCLVARISCSTD